MEFGDSHVLITGGAGLVGSHLAESILEAGGTVRVADDLSKGDRARVPVVANTISLFSLRRDFFVSILPSHMSYLTR